MGLRDNGGTEITHCGLVRVKTGAEIVCSAADDFPPLFTE
jgi:hypothetical protein